MFKAITPFSVGCGSSTLFAIGLFHRGIVKPKEAIPPSLVLGILTGMGTWVGQRGADRIAKKFFSRKVAPYGARAAAGLVGAAAVPTGATTVFFLYILSVAGNLASGR